MNIADPLSRLSARIDDEKSNGVCNVADDYIMMIANLAVPKAMNFDQVKRAARECLEMDQIRKALMDGNWSRCLPAYKAVLTELAEVEGVIMRGERIVVPVSLRPAAVELAHEGHQGMSKTKHLLRSKLWWPGMDGEVENFCRECYDCQLVGAPSRPPPMTSVGSGFRVDSNRSGKMQSGRVESRAVLTLVILTG